MVRVPPSRAASLAACEVAANGAGVGGDRKPNCQHGVEESWLLQGSSCVCLTNLGISS